MPPERRHRWQGSLDQILASQQQAGRLRAAQGFSSGEDHEVKSLAGVLPQILFGRCIRGSVIHSRHSMLFGDLNELIGFDLPVGLRFVEKEHHAGLLIDRRFQFLSRFDGDDTGAAEFHLMLVAGAMGFLLDYFEADSIAIR